jgi:hypothetical protein
MKKNTRLFLLNNWNIIARVWDDVDNVSFYEMIDDIENLESGNISDVWSCFFSAAFILDIYGYRSYKDTEGIIVSDIDQLLSDFEPGYIYHFNVFDHEFVVIYESPRNIYYVDYYQETNRDERGFPLFRFDCVKKKEIVSLLEAYLDEDFVKWAEFHHGDEEYYDSYVKEYQKAKTYDTHGDTINFYQLEYRKYKINKTPTIESIIRTINNSRVDVNQRLESYPISYRQTYNNLFNILVEESKKYK